MRKISKLTLLFIISVLTANQIDTIINKHVYTRNNKDLLNHYSGQIYDIIQTKHLTTKKTPAVTIVAA